jgi:drug/metabolite transporter (DMT)-like permease
MQRQWTKFGSGFQMAVAANILWGTSFLASKQALMAWGPYTTSVFRLGLALVAIWSLAPRFGVKIERPRSLREWGDLGLVGLLSFGLLYPLQFQGLRYIPSALLELSLRIRRECCWESG